MRNVLGFIALFSIGAAGCAGRPVRTFIGRPASECRSVGEVRGFRGEPVGRNDRVAGPQVLEAAARAGADAVRFRSAVDEELRGIGYACGDARIRVVRVVESRYFKTEPPASCEEIGVVESTLARNQSELREILTTSAAGMGGNVMRFDSSGARAANGNELVTGVGTAFFCPDL
jgi:hypothetical protein